MRNKLFSLFAILALAVSTFGQVATDWKAVDDVRYSYPDGKHYRLFYSPSMVTRSGDTVTIPLRSVFDKVDDRADSFVSLRLDCKELTYTYAVYDTTVVPATLSTPSAWKSIKPETAGAVVAPMFCPAK